MKDSNNKNEQKLADASVDKEAKAKALTEKKAAKMKAKEVAAKQAQQEFANMTDEQKYQKSQQDYMGGKALLYIFFTLAVVSFVLTFFSVPNIWLLIAGIVLILLFFKEGKFLKYAFPVLGAICSLICLVFILKLALTGNPANELLKFFSLMILMICLAVLAYIKLFSRPVKVYKQFRSEGATPYSKYIHKKI